MLVRYLDQLLLEVGVEPSVENRVAHTGAHGDDVAQTKAEEIDFEAGHLEKSEVSDGEEKVKRKR